jgi:hypothetical protein
MDVDMLVSSKLAKSLLQPRQAELMRSTCSQRTVYVMPAFETYGPDAASQADRLVRQSKTFLVRSVGKQVIAPFDSKRFPIVRGDADEGLVAVIAGGRQHWAATWLREARCTTCRFRGERVRCHCLPRPSLLPPGPQHDRLQTLVRDQ